MVSCPVTFEPVARQHIMAGAHGGVYSSHGGQEAKRIERAEVQISHSRAHFCDLTSSN
jgi:hypothetical protein